MPTQDQTSLVTLYPNLASTLTPNLTPPISSLTMDIAVISSFMNSFATDVLQQQLNFQEDANFSLDFELAGNISVFDSYYSAGNFSDGNETGRNQTEEYSSITFELVTMILTGILLGFIILATVIGKFSALYKSTFFHFYPMYVFPDWNLLLI